MQRRKKILFDQSELQSFDKLVALGGSIEQRISKKFEEKIKKVNSNA